MPETRSQAAPKSNSNSSGGGIRQWLIDSYNGIYRILLKPNMPAWSTVFVLIVGLIIGMFWAYIVAPVQWAGGNPNRLNQGAQDQWIKMAAVGYDQQSFYDADQVGILLSQVDQPMQRIQQLIETTQPGTADYNALVALQEAVAGAGIAGTAAPEAPSALEQFLQLAVPILLIALVFIVLTLLWRLLIHPNLVQPLQDRIRMTRDAEYAATRRQQQAALKTMQEQRRLVEEMKSSSQDDAELGAPVMQSLSIFKRNVPYDDSKEIERKTATGSDFLGQCGAVVAEAVDPDPVALEIWVFDMASQQDKKKAFITPQASNDPSIQARLAADMDNGASDIIVAQPGSTLFIDTDALRLKATVSSVDVSADGRFENAQIQLQAWAKNASNMPAVNPTPTMTATPTPVMPTQTPSSVSQQPPQQSQAPQAPMPPTPQPPAWDAPDWDEPEDEPEYNPYNYNQQPQSSPSIGSLLDGDTAPVPPQPFGGNDPFAQPPYQQPQQPASAPSYQPSPPPPPSALQYPPGMEPDIDDDEDDYDYEDYDDNDPFGDTGNFRPGGF
ncbi:hypothetical protein G4Y79_14150 [Phototrophicus methaneseepsis]|uniref:Uncharacterized protein n=1 Tax=Phototrophicus methaneseepsis TaxID=2710758 RepID=A0A7S8ID01_9CHLR|nr:hypothetical protein [Phototrophicus methaneseepsis]QPC80849.1 hypothetical protein G4Y79_14150 [Phototrophicus methaneseepsis]